MFSHITVGTSKLTRALRFYDAALAPLGITRRNTYKVAASYAPEGFAGTNHPFWVVRPFDGETATAGNGTMVAFEAATRGAVDKFYAAALAAGGKDNGPPGLRPHYHANYYGAFVLDPDGHNIEAVCHAPA